MTTTPTPLDPESLVARIMEELRANPAAQQMLMRALLTREFLGMPLRLERIEAQLDAILGRVDSLEEGQHRLEGRMDSLEEGQHRLEGRMDGLEEGQRRLEGRIDGLEEGQRRLEGRIDGLEEGQRNLQNTVGALVGDNLELKLPGRIVPLLSQKIRLRRAEIVRSPTTAMSSELADVIADAVDKGVLENWQESRIGLTDIIVRAQRRADRSPVWLAVEASGAIHRRDIERARQAADSLAAAFRQDAIAVVAGYEIASEESRQADDVGVEVLIVE